MIQESGLADSRLYAVFNYAKIGIFKTEFPMSLKADFHRGDHKEDTLSGYGIDYRGKVTELFNPEPYHKRKQNYNFEMSDGDIIEMEYLNQQTCMKFSTMQMLVSLKQDTK